MKHLLFFIGLAWSFAAPVALAQVVQPEGKVTRQDVLNSPAPESNIALTADRLTIYFSSLRGGNWWNQGDADIFYSIRLDTSDAWSRPFPLPIPINDELGQDEVHISPDGSTLTYQRWSHDWVNEGGPYYETTRVGNTKWSDPAALGGNITAFFTNSGLRATDGMTRLRDGSIIFAAGPDFKQPMDLYYSKSLGNGNWQEVQPLACNTPFDERSVFLAGDGKTMYFASNRPSGRGGLDVYRLELREDGALGTLENIGPPVNTERDELGFVIHNEQEAYFIRDGDIYQVESPDLRLVPEKSVVGSEPVESPVPAEPPVVLVPPVENTLVPAPYTPDTLVPVPEVEVVSSGPIRFEKINNIVFLLDVSNSMDAADKLPLMLGSIRRIVPSLRKLDQVSVISFATKPSLLLNGVAGDQQKFIGYALDDLKAGGKTEGKEALQLAFRCATSHFIEGGNNVVVLASDGIMDRSKLKPLVASAAKKGIRLVVFLYGTPLPEISNAFQDLTKTSNGWQRSILPENIDIALREALLATLRE